MNNLICISGASGVGKTTISRLLAIVMESDDTLVLCGDDLHKWDRKDKNWEIYTHLNPQANDLETGFRHIVDLMENKKIFRKTYNHETGLFNEEKEIEPKKNIIYEGLHALYDTRIRNLCNLKIFVDTEENLKKEWKISRDVKKRGYSIEKVLETIKLRENDEKLFIYEQKQYADVIITFKKIDDSIEMECVLINETKKQIVDLLKEIYEIHKNFLFISKNEKINNLIQNSGGNISYKHNNKIIISSSGISMKDLEYFNGYCVCDIKKIKKNIKTDYEYFNNIFKSKIFESKERPSMETLLHIKMKKKFSLHTHPIFLNSILCSKQGKKILSKIFKNLKYQYVAYKTPGIDLGNFINPREDIIFLQNHGLIVTDNLAFNCLKISADIEEKCKDFFKNSTIKHTTNQPLFPDYVVFQEKYQKINDIIYSNILSKGLDPSFLSNTDIKKLFSLETEKYRISLK